MKFSIELPVRDFDLGLTVSSGQVFRWQRQPDGTWLAVDGDHWYRVVEQNRESAEEAVSASLVHATGLNRDDRRNALAYVAEAVAAYVGPQVARYEVETNGSEETFRRLFRLDWDADSSRAEILHRGPELEPYLAAMSGLRLMRPSGSTETFFSFLCTPNNNLPRIVGMVRHLASFGPDLAPGLPRFPDVPTLAAIPEGELRARGFGYRAATIPHIAQDVLRRGGDDYILSLRDVPYAEAHRELLSFKGIGPKLADCIALFALHHTEAVPVDTHLWQAATRLYFPEWQGTNLTDKKYEAISAFIRGRFGELTGWAHQCLFYDNVLNWRSRK